MTGAGAGGALRAHLIRRTAAAATSASTPAARKATVYSPVCVGDQPGAPRRGRGAELVRGEDQGEDHACLLLRSGP